MELEPQQTTIRRINYTVLVFLLALVSAGLVWLILQTTHACEVAKDETTRAMLLQMSRVAFATLGLTTVILSWVCIRWLRLRLAPETRLPETHYVDAWSEAGKRIQAPSGEELEDQNQDDNWRE